MKLYGAIGLLRSAEGVSYRYLRLTVCVIMLLQVSWSSNCRKPADSSTEETPPKNELGNTIDTDYGTYTIYCVAGEKFMEVAGDILYNQKYHEGQKIVQEQAATAAGGEHMKWQKWHVIYQETVDGDDYYHIRNLHSGQLLEVPNGSGVAGLQLQQGAAVDDDRNLWRIVEAGTIGSYYVINKATGYALANKDGLATNGNPIVQEMLDPALDRQRWVFTALAPDSYRDDVVVRFFNRNESHQGSVAFDQGNTIPLSYGSNDGKILWVTQDAWDGNNLQPNATFVCGGFHSYSNSVMIQPAKTDWNPANTGNVEIDNSSSGKPRQVFDIQPGTSWTWSGPGIEIGDKVYVHCLEGNGLEATNQSLYELTQNTAGSVWTAARTTPTGLSGNAAIRYDKGMVEGPDGYVYAFGGQSTAFGYSLNVHVARFPISDPQSWSFWDGAGWVNNPVTGAAAGIAEGLGTVSVAFVNDKYVLLSMENGFNCDGDQRIYMSTADSPTGPFTAPVHVYTLNEYFYGQRARFYTPVIHPFFDNGQDELLVTYSLNFSACGLPSCQEGYQNPYYYRLKGIRIPYSMFGL